MVFKQSAFFTMHISFTKMHGLGNDFIVIDNITQSFDLTREQLIRLSDRHYGVGCDQILLVEKSHLPKVDFRYRIFNADGGEVQQCGNGARCFARFVRDKGLTEKNTLIVETLAGLIELHVLPNGEVTVNMGIPHFAPEEIPFQAEEIQAHYPIQVADKLYSIGAVSMGNPHAVLIVDNISIAPVAELGPLLENHLRFPQRVNVGFMQIISPSHIRLRVYERGAGETLACGTGACAAVVVGQRMKLLNPTVQVNLPGGRLQITWTGESDAPVLMSGPATRVFEGTIEITNH